MVTLFTGPVQLRRGAEWVAVDLTLQSGADGVVRPVAAPHELTLTPTGPVVHFADGGSAALDPVAAGPLPAPALAGHRATYAQVAPGNDLVVEATRAGFAASIRRSGTAVGPAPTLALTTAGGAEGVHTEVSGAEVGRTESAVSRVVTAAPRVGAAPVPFDTTVQTTVLRSDTSGHPDLRVGSYDGVAVARSFLSWDLTGAPVAAATLRVHQDWVVVVPSGRLGGVVVGGMSGLPRRSVRRRAGPPSRPSNGCGRRAPRPAATAAGEGVIAASDRTQGEARRRFRVVDHRRGGGCRSQ